MRISATALESFRLFLQPDQDWMTEDRLLAGLRGHGAETPEMRRGTAFGKVLEDPDAHRVGGGYACLGYTFGAETMAPAFAVVDRRGVFEAKAQRTYGPHDVVAKADHLLGTVLTEFKTSEGFDIEKYLPSAQWRLMADIFEPSQVTYRVFVLQDHGNGVVEVRSVESFTVYPYATLHEECAALVREFAAYAELRGLEPLLRARQEAA